MIITIPAMTLNDAVDAVASYLLRQECTFVLSSAREVDAAHFQVSVQEVRPERRARAFQVTRETLEDCWTIEEMTESR